MPGTRKLLTVVLILGALTLGTAVAIEKLPDAAEPNLSSKDLIEAARNAYEVHKVMYQRGAGSTPEDLYVWSKRWMTALNPAGGATRGVKAHVERMEELEASTKVRHEAARASGGELAAARYYVTEAKLMLARTAD